MKRNPTKSKRKILSLITQILPLEYRSSNSNFPLYPSPQLPASIFHPNNKIIRNTPKPKKKKQYIKKTSKSKNSNFPGSQRLSRKISYKQLSIETNREKERGTITLIIERDMEQSRPSWGELKMEANFFFFFPGKIKSSSSQKIRIRKRPSNEKPGENG